MQGKERDMKGILSHVLLIDDDEDCNFFHKRLFNKMEIAKKVHVATNGQEALDYLTTKNESGDYPHPDVIFLDINMPVIDGWEFLEAYEKLEDNQKAKVVLIMLTTSLNLDDREKAKRHKCVDDFYNKYLSRESLIKIIDDHFV